MGSETGIKANSNPVWYSSQLTQKLGRKRKVRIVINTYY